MIFYKGNYLNEEDFINLHWIPFLNSIQRHVQETRRRAGVGYMLHQRLPTQNELDILQQECIALTTAWYGKGNISVLFAALVEMSQDARISAYTYAALQIRTSNDGYLSIFGKDFKTKLVKEYNQQVMAPYIAQGGVIWEGRSPIDTAHVSPVIVTPEYLKLNLKIRIEAYLLSLINKHRRKNGKREIANFGSIPQNGKQAVWDLVNKAIERKNIHQQADERFDEFATLCRTKPIEAMKKQDLLTLWSGIKSNKLKLLSSTFMQSLNLQRQLSFSWRRRYALKRLLPGGEVVIVRPAGAAEISIFKAAPFPLLQLHGISIPGNATTADNEVCDIEKVVYEFEFINPAPKNMLLAGERRFNVGKNSYTGSSIKQTQHMHFSEGTITQFKIYELNNSPEYAARLDGTIDLVQIGSKFDAFFIKATTKCINDDEYLQFFIDLIAEMQRKFGSQAIDFYFHIVPTEDGRYVTIMAPFARLIKEAKPHKITINPETGENHLQQKVAEHLSLCDGSKIWGVDFDDESLAELWLQNGRERLGALYDFTVKSGARNFVTEYVREFQAKDKRIRLVR